MLVTCLSRQKYVCRDKHLWRQKLYLLQLPPMIVFIDTVPRQVGVGGRSGGEGMVYMLKNTSFFYLVDDIAYLNQIQFCSAVNSISEQINLRERGREGAAGGGGESKGREGGGGGRGGEPQGGGGNRRGGRGARGGAAGGGYRKGGFHSLPSSAVNEVRKAIAGKPLTSFDFSHGSSQRPAVSSTEGLAWLADVHSVVL